MLPPNEIMSELSYAYLHAVAAKAGFSCKGTPRPVDNAGVDAWISWKEQLDPRSVHTEDDVRVQLKATTKSPAEEDGKLSYFLEDVARYDQYRTRRGHFPVLLVVLFLPADSTTWLEVSDKELLTRRCAYWVSLWGAPPTRNTSGATVRLPRSNMLTPNNLRDVIRRLSIGEEVVYDG